MRLIDREKLIRILKDLEDSSMDLTDLEYLISVYGDDWYASDLNRSVMERCKEGRQYP